MGIKYLAPDNLDEYQLSDFYSQLGDIHEAHPTQNDNTLCGMAIIDNTYNAYSVAVNKKATCKDCVAIIDYCKKL